MYSGMDGETTAECFYEIFTDGPCAHEALSLLRIEIISDTGFAEEGRRELLRVLNSIEAEQRFGRNPLTELLVEIFALG